MIFKRIFLCDDFVEKAETKVPLELSDPDRKFLKTFPVFRSLKMRTFE